jgi:hypothetical protein
MPAPNGLILPTVSYVRYTAADTSFQMNKINKKWSTGIRFQIFHCYKYKLENFTYLYLNWFNSKPWEFHFLYKSYRRFCVQFSNSATVPVDFLNRCMAHVPVPVCYLFGLS